jgi:hypothetical protein
VLAERVVRHVDECQPPSPGVVPVIPSPWGLEEGNGAICLLGTCVYVL